MEKFLKDFLILRARFTDYDHLPILLELAHGLEKLTRVGLIGVVRIYPHKGVEERLILWVWYFIFPRELGVVTSSIPLISILILSVPLAYSTGVLEMVDIGIGNMHMLLHGGCPAAWLS